MKNYFYLVIFSIISLLSLTACNHSSKPTLKVAATSVPHAELLELIAPDLQAQGIELEVLIIDDFNTPNRALADKEVDANFFQHAPFLDAQMNDFNYQLEKLVAVHLEPMALYSKKNNALDQIKKGASIAIPSDPSNQARALALFEQVGFIKLKIKNSKTSLQDVVENPMQLKFIEIDSPLLSRTLDEVDIAAITTNFALLAGLSPKKEALAVENSQSDFANILVIRKGESEKPEIQALKKALTTQKIKDFIDEHYQGAVIAVF